MEFWAAIQKAAVSRQAIRDGLREFGHDVTDSAIGRWVRGETDPGLDITVDASRRWKVSLDEFVFGEPEDQRLREQVADHAQRLDVLERTQDLLLGWLLADPDMVARLMKHAPELLERKAG